MNVISKLLPFVKVLVASHKNEKFLWYFPSFDRFLDNDVDHRRQEHTPKHKYNHKMTNIYDEACVDVFEYCASGLLANRETRFLEQPIAELKLKSAANSNFGANKFWINVEKNDKILVNLL